jgi:hypothetical protein
MVKCSVLFEVRTEFLNIIYMSFGFKGLSTVHYNQLQRENLSKVNGEYLLNIYTPHYVSFFPVFIVCLYLLPARSAPI